jgi:hypothetical protein
VDRVAHAAIAAEPVFGERSINLVGELQWIIAVYSARVIRHSAAALGKRRMLVNSINAYLGFVDALAVAELQAFLERAAAVLKKM